MIKSQKRLGQYKLIKLIKLKVFENVVSQVIFIPDRVEIALRSLASLLPGPRIEWRLDGLPVDLVKVDLNKSPFG